MCPCTVRCCGDHVGARDGCIANDVSMLSKCREHCIRVSAQVLMP